MMYVHTFQSKVKMLLNLTEKTEMLHKETTLIAELSRVGPLQRTGTLLWSWVHQNVTPPGQKHVSHPVCVWKTRSLRRSERKHETAWPLCDRNVYLLCLIFCETRVPEVEVHLFAVN